MRFQIVGSFLIVHPLLMVGVPTAIQFNDQECGRTEEIYNEWPYRVLSAKLCTV